MRWIAPLLVLAGCASGQGAPQTKLELDFSWAGIENCAKVSPEIRLAGIPPGTRRFKIELVDIDVMMAEHGGGAAANDGTGVIPKGALKSFTGPCPPGLPHRYEIRVSALSADGAVLARGAETRVFPPETPRLLPRRPSQRR